MCLVISVNKMWLPSFLVWVTAESKGRAGLGNRDFKRPLSCLFLSVFLPAPFCHSPDSVSLSLGFVVRHAPFLNEFKLYHPELRHPNLLSPGSFLCPTESVMVTVLWVQMEYSVQMGRNYGSTPMLRRTGLFQCLIYGKSRPQTASE